ncbi:related to RSC1 - component of the RSC chromatin remodeling complex [Ustilago sp. UG-2017a]|nr:related to RSC1 - component of the RSC chromatin remodeling complex [Ustilago sp. UG-2017a]
MSRRGGGGGIQSTNVLQGPRKRLRGNNDASTFNHDAPAAFAASSSSGSSTATMGTIERKIHSLSIQQVTQYGQKLMDTVIQAIDPSDRAPLHEFFLQLPDAQEYPDYYEIIKRPMALEEIQQKLDQHSYAALPDVKHDFETICNNAKRYNLRDTPVWLKAKELHSLIKITYVHILQSLPEPSANPPPPPSAAGAQSTPTRSKRITIRTKQSSQKLNDQMQPKAEPEQHQPPILTQQQQQQHPQQPQPQQHNGQQSQTLAFGSGMQQPPEGPFTAAGTPSTQAGDDDDDDDDDAWENDGDSSRLTKGGQLDGRKRPGKRGKRLKATLRQLVHDLRRVIGTRGYPIVQHFDYLPDRNQVPQYYQVIQKPICLRDIEHSVFHKSYINAHALFSDLELMLTNAITFYPPDSPIWQDAQEIRQYFEREAIPALFQDGFTLEKDDVRQSALPLHLAANSTIEAHKSAYKMIVSKAMGGASQSPEPSSRSRLGSAGVVGSPALSAAPGLPLGSPAPGAGAGAFGSPSPAAQPNPTAAAMMGTPSASPAPMMGTPIGSMPPMSMPSMPPPMSTPGSASMSPLVPGIPGTAPPMGMLNSPGLGRPLPYPGTPTSASPFRPTPTSEGRRPVGRPPGKSTPSRSNPYPFLERRIGPGRPKKHEAAARQAAIAAHEEMLRKMALENQQDEMSQQQAAAFAAQPVPQWGQQQILQQQQLQQQLYLQQQQRQQEQQLQRQQQQQQRRAQQAAQQATQQAQLQQQQAYVEQQRLQQQQQMLPPGGGAPAPFGAGMAVEAASPAKRKEAVLPAQTPRALAFEGLESRTPLVSNFAIDMEVEAPDGQTLAVPSVEIKNGFTTQHSLQIPPNASSITIEFPLRILKKPKAEDAPADGEEDVSMSEPTCNNAVANRDTHSTSGDAAEEEAKKNRILTYPWRPELSFNGKQTTATWVAADSLVDSALQEEEELGYSYCKVRLLPKRGINVLEINVKPAVEANELEGIPDERYSIFFC